MPTRPLVIRYEDDLDLFPGVWHRVGLVVALVLLLAIPFVASPRWLTVSNLALVSVVGAVGLMVLTGFAGQISLGHAAFLAVGAYTVAIVGEQWHFPFWLASSWPSSRPSPSVSATRGSVPPPWRTH